MADFEFVQIHNTGTKLLKFPIPKAPGDRTPGIRWAEIQPGQFLTTNFLSAVSAFGHPKERDIGNRRHRTDIYRSLRGQWGFYEGFDTETEDEAELKRQTQDPTASSWEAKCPKFKVTTLEGTYIPMILDDPAGSKPIPNDDGSLTPELASEGASIDALLALVKQQQAQMDKMQAMIVAQASVSPVATDDRSLPQPPADEHEPTQDSPTAPRTSSRARGSRQSITEPAGV